MDFAYLDYLANFTKSVFHQGSVGFKILLVAAFIAGAILSQNFEWLIFWYVFILFFIIAAKLPFFKIWLVSLYPLIFALIFAYSAADSAERFALICLKVVCASSAMIFLLATTPYPQIFDWLSHFLPATLTAALFLTYRSMFILVGTIENLKDALKLRNGLNIWRHPLITLKNIGNGIGVLLIKALDISTEMSAIMKLRGFTGKVYYFKK